MPYGLTVAFNCASYVFGVKHLKIPSIYFFYPFNDKMGLDEQIENETLLKMYKIK